jgi:hypothetical protein
MMKKYALTIGVGIVCAIVFFFIGRVTVGAPAAMGGAPGSFGSSTRGGLAARSGGGFAAGQILSVDAGSLTLQLANGNSEIVFYSSSTQIIKPQPADASALTTGARVLVGGASNSDGSVTASTIQVGGAMPVSRTGGGQ